jgi:hypothetical protein
MQAVILREGFIRESAGSYTEGGGSQGSVQAGILREGVHSAVCS